MRPFENIINWFDAILQSLGLRTKRDQSHKGARKSALPTTTVPAAGSGVAAAGTASSSSHKFHMDTLSTIVLEYLKEKKRLASFNNTATPQELKVAVSGFKKMCCMHLPLIAFETDFMPGRESAPEFSKIRTFCSMSDLADFQPLAFEPLPSIVRSKSLPQLCGKYDKEANIASLTGDNSIYTMQHQQCLRKKQRWYYWRN